MLPAQVDEKLLLSKLFRIDGLTTFYTVPFNLELGAEIFCVLLSVFRYDLKVIVDRTIFFRVYITL